MVGACAVHRLNFPQSLNKRCVTLREKLNRAALGQAGGGEPDRGQAEGLGAKGGGERAPAGCSP